MGIYTYYVDPKFNNIGKEVIEHDKTDLNND